MVSDAAETSDAVDGGRTRTPVRELRYRINRRFIQKIISINISLNVKVILNIVEFDTFRETKLSDTTKRMVAHSEEHGFSGVFFKSHVKK